MAPEFLLSTVGAVDVDKCGSGHESAGEVVEVGEGVTEWKAGMLNGKVHFCRIYSIFIFI